jgi:hypothetical protein
LKHSSQEIFELDLTVDEFRDIKFPEEIPATPFAPTTDLSDILRTKQKEKTVFKRLYNHHLFLWICGDPADIRWYPVIIENKSLIQIFLY